MRGMSLHSMKPMLRIVRGPLAQQGAQAGTSGHCLGDASSFERLRANKMKLLCDDAWAFVVSSLMS